jgi:hypothetical protein
MRGNLPFGSLQGEEMHTLQSYSVGFLVVASLVCLFVTATAFVANCRFRRKLAALSSIAVLVALLSAGCNAATTAQDFANVIAGILNIAKAEVPALPADDAAIVAQWTTLGTALEGQLQTCINGATTAGSKKAAFLACFNVFAGGIVSPSELAQLRVLTSGSQTKVQLWVTAMILGVNAALTAFGGTPAATPKVAAQPPSHQDIVALARRLQIDRLPGL